MDQLFSTGQVARLVGVPSYKIEYAHANNHLGEPTQRVMNKRLYTAADVRRVAQHFGIVLDEQRLVGDGEKGAK